MIDRGKRSKTLKEIKTETVENISRIPKSFLEIHPCKRKSLPYAN